MARGGPGNLKKIVGFWGMLELAVLKSQNYFLAPPPPSVGGGGRGAKKSKKRLPFVRGIFVFLKLNKKVNVRFQIEEKVIGHTTHVGF